VGAPARQVRPLQESEKEFLEYSAQHYIHLKNEHLKQARG
jgi:carbonic anhydrase/acetyltransferase-like protein (isoleucine patch superfamily)